MKNKKEETRTIVVSASTAMKLDMVKSGLLFTKGKKETTDTLLDAMLEEKLSELKKNLNTDK